MASVTQRINQIKQPEGGYLNPNSFKKIQKYDNEELKQENIPATLVGLAVDYLARVINGTSSKEAFKVSLLGADIIGENNNAYKLLKNINGNNTMSIINACKLVGYDVCYRAGPALYKNVENIMPDENTVNNIKIMLNRMESFFLEYGPMKKQGFSFEGAYTELISAGDGDFLTNDTLWDFKVSLRKPTSAHTLQILIYYIMGMKCDSEFKNIKQIGIFNPRTNTIYLKKIADIPSSTIDAVSEKVVGYHVNEKKSIANEDSSSDILLYMADIMKRLNCSRHMVMKYYSQNNLPLFKDKNKYCIHKSDLESWIIKFEAEKKQQTTAILIGLFVFIAVFILIIASIAF